MLAFLVSRMVDLKDAKAKASAVQKLRSYLEQDGMQWRDGIQ